MVDDHSATELMAPETTRRYMSMRVRVTRTAQMSWKCSLDAATKDDCHLIHAVSGRQICC
jgi:hypothetical protein